jgi:hypothetical protein
MAQKEQAKKAKADKDIIARLTDAGEDAVQRLGELPGGKTMVEAANTFRERLDELAARIRSIDPLEKRVARLEERLGALEQTRKAPARRSTAPRTSPRPRSAPPTPEPESAAPVGEPPA